MQKYRKKPVVVEAVKLSKANAAEVTQWCGGLEVEEVDPYSEAVFVGVNIPTLEGTMRASEGDYVIKGTQGEFYPCKPDAFDGTFELVNG